MSTLAHFVTRNGKRIEVETLPSKPKASKARQREANLFVKVPLKWANAASRAAVRRSTGVMASYRMET